MLNDQKTVSILGCGWYGMQLAKALVADNFIVKGSTTTNYKLKILQEIGIKPYIIHFEENTMEFDADFFNSKTLVICIPPKRSTGEQATYPSKITQICNAAKNHGVNNILFISSTSVYADNSEDINQQTLPNPQTESGKAILEAEQIIKRHENFRSTILRFSGLVGPDRDPGRFFAGKTNVPNGLAPINLIHLKDCVAIGLSIIKQNAYDYTLNASSPDHMAKQDFYKLAAVRSGLEKPTFIPELKTWKTINSDHLSSLLNYKYQIDNWTAWLQEDKL